MEQTYKTFRGRVFQQLNASHWPHGGLSPANWVIVLLVTASVLAVVLETEPALMDAHHLLFQIANFVVLVAFTVEYVARVWSAPEHPEYGGMAGRLRYMRTPMAIIDLMVVLPLWLVLSTDLIGVQGSVVVAIRLFRVLQILKLARIPGVVKALHGIERAVSSRKFELILTFLLAIGFMLLAATALYLVEGDVQPEEFGSIPRAMWWGMATLTTVGYGDVVPITPLGRVFAGFFAISGVGLAAMPAGIFAAALSSIYHEEQKGR